MRGVPIIALCLAGFATTTRADGTSTLGLPGRAALEALRGNSKQARALLAAREDDPASLVVLASIALDQGDLRDARRAIERLRAASPQAVEARLLDALVRERAERPRRDWASSGLAALVAVHPLPKFTPLLSVTDVLLGDELASRAMAMPFPEDAASRLPVSDRFLARWAWPHPSAVDPILLAEAVRVAGADERPLVLLAAVDVLSSAAGRPGGGARDEEITTAKRAALAKLRGTPAERLRFLTLAPKTESEPMTEEEATIIEAAIRDDDPPAFAGQYAELLRILDKVDPAPAALFAQAAAIRLQFPPTAILTIVDRAARGSLPAASRARLAAALVRLAERQRREGLVLTDLFAAAALGQASALRNDAALVAQAEAVRPNVQILQDAARCFGPLLALPIRSMQRDWAETKAHERAFVQQAARMGLSCPEPKPRPKSTRSETP